MEDKRAHERIDGLEKRQDRLELALAENTSLTKQIADNTAELVSITRSAKAITYTATWSAGWIRKSALWASPIAVVAGVIYEWLKVK